MLLLFRAHRLRLTSGVEVWTSLSSVEISVICGGFTVSAILRDLPMCPSFLANPSSHWSRDICVICQLTAITERAACEDGLFPWVCLEGSLCLFMS